MIVGIGTDIVEIERINQILGKYNNRFLKKVLSDCELQQKRSWVAKDVAKRFCAKEAIVKALGTGFTNGISMAQITIEHNKQGKPLVKLTNNALNQFNNLQATSIQISISDEKSNAISFCIIESNDEF